MTDAWSALPTELQDRVLSYLHLDQLIGARAACRSLHGRVLRRFLPVIAPPTLCNQTLSMEAHGAMLIHLYGQYRKWLWQWQYLYRLAHPSALSRVPAYLLRLRGLDSALDGFFSLAPWSRIYGEMVKDDWQTERWLHDAVYGGPVQAPAQPTDKSRFHQRRVRDEEDAFRIFYSSPAGAMEEDLRRGHLALARRFIIQPLNMRRADGTPHTKLPDMPEEMMRALRVVGEVLRTYFVGCEVRVEELREQRLPPRGCCRRDVQDARRDGHLVTQLSSKAIHGARDALDADGGADAFTTFVVAPHLYPWKSEQFAWVYSTPLCEVEEDDEHDRIDAWVVSTHQIEAFVEGETKRVKHLCKLVLYCVLSEGVGLDNCESGGVDGRPYCVLNNCDSIEEAEGIPLLLCPTCMRKLHLLGIVDDEPACRARLEAKLRSEGLL